TSFVSVLAFAWCTKSSSVLHQPIAGRPFGSHIKIEQVFAGGAPFGARGCAGCSLSGARRSVEVGRLAFHPLHEPRNRLAGKEVLAVAPFARQFGIAEVRVDLTVADRVKRHRLPAALGFGHEMMELHLGAQRPFTQPAGAGRLAVHPGAPVARSLTLPRHHKNRPEPMITAAPARPVKPGRSPKNIQPNAAAISS